MRKVSVTTIAAAAIALNCRTASAQSMDYGALQQLFGEPVTTSASGSPQRASEVPLAMEIITAEKIRRSGAHDIPGILRHVAGIDVLQWTNDQADVSVRGYNEAFSHRLLVLIDGRQVYADHYGYTPWHTLPVELDAIRQIEIVKGPASALFGFNAVAGVINIVTFNPLYDDIDNASVTGGTQDLVKGSVITTFRLGEMGAVRLAGGGSFNKDFDTPVPPAMGNLRPAHDRGQISANGVVHLGQKTLLSMEASHSEANLNEVNPIYNLTAGTYHTTSVRGLLSSDTSYGLVSADAYRTWIHVSNPGTSLGDIEIRNRLTVLQIQDLFKAGTNHTFRLSAEYRDTSQGTTPFAGGRVSYTTLAAGAMWDWKISPSFSINNAVRLDHLILERTGTAPAGYPFSNAAWNRTFTEVSFNSGVVWQASAYDAFRLTAARGVQVPNLEFIGGFVAITPLGGLTGIPTLNPTTVISYEAGWERSIPAIDGHFGVSIFHQHSHDILAIQGGVIVTPTLPYFTQIRGGNSEATGVEATLDGKLTDAWRWGVNGRYESIVDALVPSAAGGFLDFEHTSPRFILNANVGWTGGKWEVDTYLHYQSRMSGHIPSVLGGPSLLAPVQDYVSVDARVAYQVTDALRLAVSGQNLGKNSQRQTSGPNVQRRILGTVSFAF